LKKGIKKTKMVSKDRAGADVEVSTIIFFIQPAKAGGGFCGG
jgi:hypothetical protein